MASDTDDEFEMVRGSGNVFRDLGLPDADFEHARVLLAGYIIRVLDERGLTPSAAEKITGIAQIEFSRIRRLKLKSFTLYKLMRYLVTLGHDVEIVVGRHTDAAHPAQLSVSWDGGAAEASSP